MKTFQDFVNDPEFFEELSLLAAQEVVAKLMDKKGISKKELAQKMGKSKSAITRLLSDGRNLRLKTLGRVLFYLDEQLQIDSKPIHPPRNNPSPIKIHIGELIKEPYQEAFRQAVENGLLGELAA